MSDSGAGTLIDRIIRGQEVTPFVDAWGNNSQPTPYRCCGSRRQDLVVLARELVDRRETIAKFMRTDVNDLNLKERDVPKEWEERRMSAICRDMIERLGALLRRARWLEAGALILAAVVVVILTLVKA